MKIKKSDQVKIIAGKDRGKIGKVLQVFPKDNRASVEGLNLLVKHLRPRRNNEKGQRLEFPAAMNISNLMLVCPHCGKMTRVAHKTVETANGSKKSRLCKKCQQTIE